MPPLSPARLWMPTAGSSWRERPEGMAMLITVPEPPARCEQARLQDVPLVDGVDAHCERARGPGADIIEAPADSSMATARTGQRIPKGMCGHLPKQCGRYPEPRLKQRSAPKSSLAPGPDPRTSERSQPTEPRPHARRARRSRAPDCRRSAARGAAESRRAGGRARFTAFGHEPPPESPACQRAGRGAPSRIRRPRPHLPPPARAHGRTQGLLEETERGWAQQLAAFRAHVERT
jgi:hypothetical protein